MYIQYTGFDVAINSRIYNFQVLDSAREQRAFTVKIQSDTNHWASLKLQDGPGICFERLEKELDRETPVSRAELNLRISELDIRDYMKRHYPPAKTYGPKDLPELSAEPFSAPAISHPAFPRLRLPESGNDPLKEKEQVTALLLHRPGEAMNLLKLALESHSIQIRSLRTLEEALPLLRAAHPPHLVFTEDTLPDGTWADVVKQASGVSKTVKVIVVSRLVDVGFYVEAMNGGAFDFIVPPLSTIKLDYVVKRAMDKVLSLRRAQAVAV
jgi:ActR/RegA family two-component response regulator